MIPLGERGEACAQILSRQAFAPALLIALSSGLEVSFEPHLAEGLSQATPQTLSKIEISPSGLGLHFPQLDADLYLPALLEGMLGSRRWMSVEADRTGGRRTSEAKAAAARANGRLGGRPRKTEVSASSRKNSPSSIH